MFCCARYIVCFCIPLSFDDLLPSHPGDDPLPINDGCHAESCLEKKDGILGEGKKLETFIEEASR